MLKSNESRIFRGSSELVSGRHARVLFPEILGQQLTVRQRFKLKQPRVGEQKSVLILPSAILEWYPWFKQGTALGSETPTQVCT